MTENDRKRPKTTLLFVSALLLAVALGFLGGRRSVTQSLLERVDTLVIRDTFVDYRPAPLFVTPLRVETVRLPLSGLAFARFADDTTSVGDTVFLQIRDTVEREMPVSLPSARTSWSTFLVDTPSIQAWQITA